MSAQRVAIVTGGGRGMGAAISRALHAEGYALSLMSPSGSASRLAAELGGIGVDGSVTEPADIARLVDATMERHGRIDAVVNNAGGPSKGDPLAVDDAAWYEALDLVLLHVVRMCRLVTPIMQAQGGGAMVNISSFTAVQPEPQFAVSSALRVSLSNFTKLYSDMYARDGIRMNNLLCGYIDSLQFAPEIPDRIPLGRIGRVGEVAATAVFLLSEGAGYITGQNIRIDGGVARMP